MKIQAQPEQLHIFAGVTSIILLARARAAASTTAAQDLKKVAVEDIQYTDSNFNRKEVKKHENQASIA